MLGEDYRNYTYAKFGRAILNQPGGVAFQIWDSQVIASLRKEEYGEDVVEKIFASTLEELAERLVRKGLTDKESFLTTLKRSDTSFDGLPVLICNAYQND